jgi:hypothetical protein
MARVRAALDSSTSTDVTSQAIATHAVAAEATAGSDLASRSLGVRARTAAEASSATDTAGISRALIRFSTDVFFCLDSTSRVASLTVASSDSAASSDAAFHGEVGIPPQPSIIGIAMGDSFNGGAVIAASLAMASIPQSNADVALATPDMATAMPQTAGTATLSSVSGSGAFS